MRLLGSIPPREKAFVSVAIYINSDVIKKIILKGEKNLGKKQMKTKMSKITSSYMQFSNSHHPSDRFLHNLRGASDKDKPNSANTRGE